eukprot:9041768-Alexandrium_andersonii.AAC.1
MFKWRKHWSRRGCEAASGKTRGLRFKISIYSASAAPVAPSWAKLGTSPANFAQSEFVQATKTP